MKITEQITEMTAQEKFNYFVDKLGWTYMSDETSWTGGCWQHEKDGFVTNGGGHFPNFMKATEALERFYKNMKAIS